MKTLRDEAARICGFLPRSTALKKVTLGYSAFNKAIYKNVTYLEGEMDNINKSFDRKMKKRLSSSRDVKAAAEIGNRAMEYYIKHGEFPTSREQLEHKMVERWYIWDGKGNYPKVETIEAIMGIDGRVSRVDRREDDENFKNQFICLYWQRDIGRKRSWNIAYTLGEMVPSKRGSK